MEKENTVHLITFNTAVGNKGRHYSGIGSIMYLLFTESISSSVYGGSKVQKPHDAKH